jgi:HAD superfamily hydrolase (TIGR01484 family)
VKDLSKLDPTEARALRGVLFDLDDTLLSHGVLTREAYDALWALAATDLRLVAVTGRPSGWGEVLARQWPIHAAVTENGAIVISRENRTIRRHDTCGETERRERRMKLAGIVERAREAVPEARLTDDVGARTSDVTWDIGESMRLPEDRIDRIVREIKASGARTTRSSVHLHATFDAHDKASGAMAWLSSAYGVDVGSARAWFAYLGDSPNDRACFAAFRTTFGVANVLESVGALSVPPRYVAKGKMGSGFAEIARALLAARG